MPISSEAHNYTNNKAHTCAYRQTHVHKETLYSEASLWLLNWVHEMGF